MSINVKKKVIVISLSQLFIIILSLMFYQKLALISYINISFYITSAFLLTSLLIYTIQTGFYDGIAKSFNYAFSIRDTKRKFHDIPSLSQMVTINHKNLIFYGLVNGLFMLLALLIYYAG